MDLSCANADSASCTCTCMLVMPCRNVEQMNMQGQLCNEKKRCNQTRKALRLSKETATIENKLIYKQFNLKHHFNSVVCC